MYNFKSRFKKHPERRLNPYWDHFFTLIYSNQNKTNPESRALDLESIDQIFTKSFIFLKNGTKSELQREKNVDFMIYLPLIIVFLLGKLRKAAGELSFLQRRSLCGLCGVDRCLEKPWHESRFKELGRGIFLPLLLFYSLYCWRLTT